MDKGIYTTTEVARITGFSLRQLDYWVRIGIITPGSQQAHGSGTRRLYTLDNLVQLNFVRQLKHYKWSTQKIHTAIAILKDVMEDPNPLKNAILIHGKGTIFALSKTKDGERVLVDALSSTGQLVMNFVLETLIEETQNSTTRLNTPVSQKNLAEVQIGGINSCR